MLTAVEEGGGLMLGPPRYATCDRFDACDDPLEHARGSAPLLRRSSPLVLDDGATHRSGRDGEEMWAPEPPNDPQRVGSIRASETVLDPRASRPLVAPGR